MTGAVSRRFSTNLALAVVNHIALEVQESARQLGTATVHDRRQEESTTTLIALPPRGPVADHHCGELTSLEDGHHHQHGTETAEI